MGLSDPGIEGVQFVDVSPRPKTMPQKALKALRLKMGRFEAAYRSEDAVRRTNNALREHDFSLIVANDIDTLPLALECRGQARVLFDAHEYAPREFEHWFLWRFFMQDYKEHLCRTRIPQVGAMTTVGPAIADEYARVFGVRPSVVLNAPYYRAAPPVPRDGDIIRMVHHGGASPLRRLEIMIDAMALLDERFQLDFMLVPNDPGYVKALKNRASSDPRIAFVPPVAPDDVVEKLSHYDVGLCTYAPYSFNGLHSLPNKFFDFIQARLCIAAGPLPEVARLVEQNKCGVMTKDFCIAAGPLPEVARLVEQNKCGVMTKDFTSASLAEALRILDRQRIEAFRQAADVAAGELCFERSADVMLDIVRELLGLGREKRAEREPEVPAR